MTLLADWLQTLGAVGLDWFWRPMLAWTLVCLPLYVGLRLWRTAPPLMQYHAHLALLLALPLSLALAPFVAWPALAPDGAVFAVEVPAPPMPDAEALPMPATVPVVAVSQPPGVRWGMAQGIGLLTALAAASAAWLLLRMVYLGVGLRRFRRRLVPVEEGRVHQLLEVLAGQVGVRETVALYGTPDETTPMTFGWQRPVIVLPEAVLADEAALRLTLRHELIHVRRRDYAVSWVVRLIGSLTAIHPGVWLLRRRIDEYREISCDAETLAGAPGLARRYAHLLLRFSPLTDLAGPTALRMVERGSTLKKRINAMHNAVRFPVSLRLRRWSLPLAAAFLLIPALLAACATENKSETVIVTAETPEQVLAEEMEKLGAEEEALARQEKELHFVERKRALEEAEHAYRNSFEFRVVQDRERALQERFTQKEFKRLAVQMEYLQHEIKKISGHIETMTGPEKEMTYQRVQLLNGMYMQRLEQFETMKMEQFTQKALADSE